MVCDEKFSNKHNKRHVHVCENLREMPPKRQNDATGFAIVIVSIIIVIVAVVSVVACHFCLFTSLSLR